MQVGLDRSNGDVDALDATVDVLWKRYTRNKKGGDLSMLKLGMLMAVWSRTVNKLPSASAGSVLQRRKTAQWTKERD